MRARRRLASALWCAITLGPLLTCSRPADATPAGPAQVQPVYRLYHPFTGQHLQTTDAHEVSVLTTIVVLDGVPYVWHTEEPTFDAYDSSGGNCPAGSDPVYRMYDSADGDHLLTADAHEVAYWTQRSQTSWTAEGVAFCAERNHAPATVPVYRILRADGHEHLLTADEQEFSRLVASGWGTSEGVAFYAPTP